jgi:hypothetical protein
MKELEHIQNERIVNQSFSWALDRIKEGKWVCRSGWNGKGMWVKLVDLQDHYINNYPLYPWIGIKTTDDRFVPWLASQTDILAEDWELFGD